ncbi:MAG: AMP-binding protein, partial [Desulfurococcales archaeon]|nr:AMP-binding protein [Desulfurococcales archaeon]
MVLSENPPWRPGYDLLIKNIYDRAIDVFPNSEIVSLTSKGLLRFKYTETAERMRLLAGALESLGVKRLETVATLDWSTHWHYEAYFAIPMMGAVLHTVNIRLSPMELVHVMNNAEDKVAIVHKDFIPLISVVAENLKNLEHIIIVDSDEVPSKIAGKPVHHYEDLIKEHGGGYQWPEDIDENLPAAMCHTGGTTGLPKGAYHTHRMIVIHAMSMALHLATFGRTLLSSRDVGLYICLLYTS